MIGKRVSHCTILSKLGEGGMGVVCKAKDTRLKRIVALKFLPPEFTQDQAARERFFHEAQAASALEHTNICSVHELGEHDGKPFLVMGFYEGETLRFPCYDFVRPSPRFQCLMRKLHLSPEVTSQPLTSQFTRP